LYREEEDTVEGWRSITFYQLGATLYDLLMRRPIFDELREPPARLYQAVKEHVPVIDANDAEPWLVDLARRCLHKDWRIRKEIVSWEDFEGPRAVPETAEAIRERLKKRLDCARVATIESVMQAAERPTRRVMYQLAGSVATVVREVSQQGGVFPPVEVIHSVEDSKSVVSVRTGPSAAHELHGVLEVRLVLDPLDATAAHIRLSAAARLGAPPSEVPADSTELFVGEHSAAALREALDRYLHAVLEAGIGTGTPPKDGLSVRPIMKKKA
jgi:hypothetical protein